MKKIILLAFIAIQTIIAQDKLKVVVLLPESANNADKGKAFLDVFGGIQRELGDDYVVSKVINSGDNSKTAQIIDSEKPNALVVMENSSIDVVKEFQKKEANQATPVFATMALQLESSAQDVKNACGVKLEVPAFTIFSNLKYISK
jgi:hypothetical protein